MREEIVRLHLPLAQHIARRFRVTHEPSEDLFQVACCALLKAIDRFDPERGWAFTSYAVPSIRGELKRYARDMSWGLRPPRGLQERALDVERATCALTARFGRSPTTAEIGTETGLSSEAVLEAIEASSNHVLESLDAPSNAEDESGTKVERLGQIERGYAFVEDAQTVAPALRELPQRERTILQLRFGEGLSQSEIASRVGISQMHVSRLLRRTLDQLSETVRAAA